MKIKKLFGLYIDNSCLIFANNESNIISDNEILKIKKEELKEFIKFLNIKYFI